MCAYYFHPPSCFADTQTVGRLQFSISLHSIREELFNCAWYLRAKKNPLNLGINRRLKLFKGDANDNIVSDRLIATCDYNAVMEPANYVTNAE